MSTVALKKSGQSVRDQVSPEEWAVRVDLAAAYRLVALHGWDDMIFTHISARVPNSDHHFLINPYGYMFEEITASSLVKVDLDGNILMDTEYYINPAGYTIHSAVHGAREEAGCVLHLHTDAGVGVSCQEQGLLPISQNALTVIEDVAYHAYEGIALNLDERERLVADIGTKNMMILRNHGTLAIGTNVAEAWTRIFFLERACSQQIAALSGGGKIVVPPESVQRTTMDQGRGLAGTAVLSWPGLLRKLDRLDPSFRS
ncbi:class II aldolase/adducin family protein [Zavarzinia sp.]|uniref:class II aldolase/adducin family protein n=1 Tax=Zavarzinia sp. TaxID=2027920 RepID=UPI003568FDC0